MDDKSTREIYAAESGNKIDGPVKPILDLWGELRRISGPDKFPALQPEHVAAIAKALHEARSGADLCNSPVT